MFAQVLPDIYEDQIKCARIVAGTEQEEGYEGFIKQAHGRLYLRCALQARRVHRGDGRDQGAILLEWRSVDYARA